jgi:hypothetical protein
MSLAVAQGEKEKEKGLMSIAMYSAYITESFSVFFSSVIKLQYISLFSFGV